MYECAYVFMYSNIYLRVYLPQKVKKTPTTKAKHLKDCSEKKFASGQSCRYQSPICWFIHAFICVCVCV